MVKGKTVGSSHGGNCTKTNAVSNIIRAKVKSRKKLFFCDERTKKQQDEVLKIKNAMFANQSKYKTFVEFNGQFNQIISRARRKEQKNSVDVSTLIDLQKKGENLLKKLKPSKTKAKKIPMSEKNQKILNLSMMNKIQKRKISNLEIEKQNQDKIVSILKTKNERLEKDNGILRRLVQKQSNELQILKKNLQQKQDILDIQNPFLKDAYHTTFLFENFGDETPQLPPID